MHKYIIVNFKTYPRGTGKEAVKMAQLCEKVGKERGCEFIVAVQPAEIKSVSEAVSIPVWAQHIDGFEPGRNTGFVLAESVKANGAVGVFLNHSEHKILDHELKDAVARAKANKLQVLIFAASPDDAVKVAKLKPDFIAYEPPELVSGDVSVSTAAPEVVGETVEKLKGSKIPVIVGAGVKSEEDVRIAFQLGSEGVALASGVMVKAEDPEKELNELADGLP